MKASRVLFLVGLVFWAGVQPAVAQSLRGSSSSSEELPNSAAKKCPTLVQGTIVQHGRKCPGRNNCPQNELCCIYGSHQECALPVGENPGYCPKAKPNPTRRCQIQCITDQQCGRGQKCCRWGCMSTCTDAEPAHPGACPERSVLRSTGPANRTCKDDRDCLPQQKCCSTRRGLQCVHPQAGLCELPMQPGSCTSSLGRYYFNSTTRSCEVFVFSGCKGNANRFYTKEDCMRVCGDPVKSGICPECLKDTECSSFCTKDSDCPGERRCCNCGCSHKCLLPVGAHPGYCPKSHVSEDAPCLVNCTSDARCGKEEKCCRKGGLSHCVAAESPHPGSCPRREVQRTAARCENACSDDRDCSPSQKCCFSGCGLQCMDPERDICRLPADPGPCDAYTARFHYSARAKTCKRFIYGGCGGNGNRFPTLDLCLWTCRYRDICQLPMVRGHCSSHRNTYYYDQANQSCESFIYHGCDGNENRFQTLEQCQNTCLYPEVCKLPVDPGPCEAHVPMYYYDPRNKTCLRFIYGGCQGNRNRFATLKLCEAACRNPDICLLPPETGPCCHFTCRYHYSPAERKCLPFPYGGCQGNANRFTTMEECVETCISKDICNLPADPGPCLGSITRFYYNPVNKMCEKFTYGGCGGNDNRFETQMECIWKCRNPDVCKLPKKSGPCRASLARYHYNSATKTCEIFIYGGCQGNENNFETLAECEHACKTTDVCRLPPNPGEGDGAKPMYYYDAVGKVCVRFTYKGHKGNANRFATLAGCQKTCKDPDICKLPRKPGPCEASIQRFYFHSTTRLCTNFTYGGCKGNLNNFVTREECRQTCQGPENPLWSGASKIPHSITDYLRRIQDMFEQLKSQQQQLLITLFLKEKQTAAEKPGSCPLRDSSRCLVTCQKDSECPGVKKCCSSGCGQVCVEPLKGKPGGCPPLPPNGSNLLQNCTQNCSHDNDCPDHEKCCSNGCGHVCTKLLL